MKKRGTIRLPNFLIVGMSRCGTTSLYHYLKEHPEMAQEIEAKIRAAIGVGGGAKPAAVTQK